MAFGMLLLRVVVGLTLAAHGSQKLFGAFGGGGIRGTAGFFGQLGFRNAPAFAVLAGLGELVGGLLLALGLLTPFGAAAAIAVMGVAIVTVHLGKGFFATNGGFELPDGSRILTHVLLPGSPAINAGDLNAVAGEEGVPLFDQRGEPFGRIVGGRIDIGAFEYRRPTDLKLLVDTLDDESDGDFSRGDLSLREAIELANAADYEGVVDMIRFDPALWAEGPARILLMQGELKIDSTPGLGTTARVHLAAIEQTEAAFDA